MMTLRNCTITADGEPFGEPGSVIVVSGDSPNAIVRIATPNRERRKFDTIDRLTAASVKGSGKSWTIQGRSEFLRNEVLTDDAEVTLVVESKGGCEGCR